MSLENYVTGLMKKNKITIIWGEATLDGGGKFTVKKSAAEAPKGSLGEGTYSGLAVAIGPTGVIADAWPLSFDSRGRETVPPMSVVPLGTNWQWVGVRHTASETASTFARAASSRGAGRRSSRAAPIRR